MIAVIIQARLGSTRLPGKVAREICGRPMLAWVVERARRIEGVDRTVVAIPDRASDDPLARLVRRLPGAELHRGPEEDVLRRYLEAARAVRAETIVRVTSDCPLLCPSVSSRVVAEFAGHRGSCDYAANTLDRTYPRGLDTEVLSIDALERAHRDARTPAEREHVTLHLVRRPDRFRLRSVTAATDHSDLRWTVDTEADLDLVTRIYEALQPGRPDFDYPEILACLERHPEWSEINRHVRQKAPST